MTVIAIFGPTASGKTAVADAVAERVPAELISADSMQVYRGVPILTAQPSRPTRMVAIWELAHEASVAEYQHLAHEAIDGAVAAGRTPIVAGGTGLYFRAALSRLALPPPPPPGLRQRLEELYDSLGPTQAHALLAEHDPRASARVHPNDRRRVVRALELTELGSSLAPEADELWSDTLRLPTLIVGLDVPKDVLERRIVARTRAMFEAGVGEEAAAATAQPLSSTALQIIGLREIAKLAPGEAEQAIILRTRQLAAYQRKWMRRIPGLATVAADRPAGEIADEILEMERSRERLPPDGGAGRG